MTKKTKSLLSTMAIAMVIMMIASKIALSITAFFIPFFPMHYIDILCFWLSIGYGLRRGVEHYKAHKNDE